MSSNNALEALETFIGFFLSNGTSARTSSCSPSTPRVSSSLSSHSQCWCPRHRRPQPRRQVAGCFSLVCPGPRPTTTAATATITTTTTAAASATPRRYRPRTIPIATTTKSSMLINSRRRRDWPQPPPPFHRPRLHPPPRSRGPP